MNTGILNSSDTASSPAVGVATASTPEFSVPTSGLSRFLTRGEHGWKRGNDDGAVPGSRVTSAGSLAV
ncbi:hypothetical protein [Gordonia oryzae]|uniref:hypothetical protein n=1 Tax=Gordonia oryzae TaxID=2487349 RepID=UPI001FE77F4D|nr:hypothetical protein [Gordonia oryzae]